MNNEKLDGSEEIIDKTCQLCGSLPIYWKIEEY